MGRSDPLPGTSMPNVHAIVGRRDERLHVRRRADEVRVGDPQPLPRDRRDELIQPEQARGRRLRADDAQRSVPAAGAAARAGHSSSGKWRTSRSPDFGERRLDVRDGWSVDRDAGVAPGVEALVALAAPPHVGDAEPGDEADAAVHADHLAVIARHPSERRVEPGLVERADVDRRRGGAAPRTSTASRSMRAEPVVEQAHAHAASRGRDERVGELAAAAVVAQDVALEVHPLFRRPDGFEPGGIVLLRIAQQLERCCPRRGARPPRARTPGRRARAAGKAWVILR